MCYFHVGETLHNYYIFVQHWTKLNVSGVKPPGRSSHATCCIASPLNGETHPLLMVVGGLDEKYKNLGDAWLLDVDKGVWNEVRMLYVVV